MKKKYILLILLGLIMLNACGKKASPSPTPDLFDEPTATPTIEPTPSVSPEVIFDPLTSNPLTGMPVEDLTQLEKRPVAIMMNNERSALPMSGISQADVIYESLAEGGITRMLALFLDATKTQNVGSVRSTRTYYLELTLGHDAILLHAGASYLAYDEMPKWGVDHIDGVRGNSGNLYFRNPERVGKVSLEHTLFTTGERIEKALESFKGRRDTENFRLGWQFTPDGTPMSSASDVTEITVNFTSNKTTKFIYDAEKKNYSIEEYNKPFIDEANNTQVSVTNVITLSTDVKTIKGDSAGRMTTRLTGTGSGTYSCGGKTVPITWSKATRDDPFVFTLGDESPLVLGMGKSYISIIPMESKVSFSPAESLTK